MAQIPSFKQNVRIGTGGSAPENPGNARAQGEGLAKLGAGVQNFAQNIGRYMDEKKKVDVALFEAEIYTQGSLKAQEGEAFAKTNPNSAQDGSQTQSDFNQVFTPLREQVAQEQDAQKRAAGLKTLGQVEAQARQRLVGYQVDKHNTFVLDKSSDIVNGMALELQQDPNKIGESLQRFDQLASQMPFMGKGKESYSKTGRRQLVTAALESYAYKGDFKTANTLLNESEAGALFTIEERKKLTKEFEGRQIKKATDTFKLDNMYRSQIKQEKQDRADETLDKLYLTMVKADSPQTMQEVRETADAALANGLLDRRAHKAFAIDQTSVNKVQSSEIRGRYFIQTLKGGTPTATIKSGILTDMENGRLGLSDGYALLKDISSQEKRAATDPSYKSEKDVAKKKVAAAINPSGMSIASIYAKADKAQNTALISEKIFKYEAEGMRPMEAADKAIAEVIGVQVFDPDSKLDAHTLNSNTDALMQMKAGIQANARRMNAEGTLDVKTKQLAAKQISDIDARIQYLQQKEKLRELSKGNK